MASPASPTGSDSDDVCLLCCEPLHDCIVGPCNHMVTCATCAVRLRGLYGDLACALCKEDMPSAVIIAPRSTAASSPFRTFDLKSLPYDKVWKVNFATTALRNRLLQLREWRCPICKDGGGGGEKPAWPSFAKLSAHLSKEHNRYICEICYRSGRRFPRELAVFTKPELAAHYSGKAKQDSAAFKGHPSCEFCRKQFYDSDELFAHMKKTHETCHICERRGQLFEYYENYQTLEQHFGKQHYLCRQTECLAKKFVVFETELEFTAHQASVHHLNLRDRKAQAVVQAELGFMYSSRGGGGSGASSSAEDDRRAVPSQSSSRASDKRAVSSSRRRGGERGLGSSRGSSTITQSQSMPDLSAPAPEPAATSSAPPAASPSSSLRPSDLLRDMQASFLGDASAFQAFRETSRSFRDGSLSAAAYLPLLIDAFGAAKCEELIPKMARQLPSRDRARALLAEYESSRRATSAKSKEREATAKSKRRTRLASSSVPDLTAEPRPPPAPPPAQPPEAKSRAAIHASSSSSSRSPLPRPSSSSSPSLSATPSSSADVGARAFPPLPPPGFTRPMSAAAAATTTTTTTTSSSSSFSSSSRGPPPGFSSPHPQRKKPPPPGFSSLAPQPRPQSPPAPERRRSSSSSTRQNAPGVQSSEARAASDAASWQDSDANPELQLEQFLQQNLSLADPGPSARRPLRADRVGFGIGFQGR